MLLKKNQSNGVGINRYGEITTDLDKKVKTKKYESLTGEEKTQLEGIISRKAGAVSRKKMRFDETK